MGLHRHTLTGFRVVLAITVVVILLLATTQMDYPYTQGLSDKFTHPFAFLVLSLLVDFSFPESRLGVLKISALLVYGLLIEAIQYFLPYRDASVLDLVMDAAGIGFYALLVPFLQRLPFFQSRWERNTRGSTELPLHGQD